MREAPERHPVQARAPLPGRGARVPAVLTKRAYEVYSDLYGTRQSLERLNERAGFGVGELLAFLYARSFPRAEWRARVDEGLRGMDLEGRRDE